MTASPHPISPLRQRMIEDMRMRKLGRQDPGRIRARRALFREVSRALTRYRDRRGSAELPAVPR